MELGPDTIKLAQLIDLVNEALSEDPVDFEEAGVDKDSCVPLIASYVLQMEKELGKDPLMSAEDVRMVWLTVVAKCLVENNVLHAINFLNPKTRLVRDRQTEQAAKEQASLLLSKVKIMSSKKQ